ncbi:hypothetical protein [Serratia marcescens]|uniref:hypothetical protein n=1 Tax=Serratia marcescens TaxID=615 RepID=UPI001F5B0B2A|nr:hypothetical protein [Serratia marcescens]
MLLAIALFAMLSLTALTVFRGVLKKRRNHPAQIDAVDPAATGAGDRRARFDAGAGARADRR